MAKAYSELESKLGQAPADDAGDPPADSDDTAAAKDAVANAGVDWDSLEAEYLAKGKLSDETKAALEQAGIPGEVVDRYCEGQKAAANAQIESILKDFGG
jgi:hypothetical protein